MRRPPWAVRARRGPGVLVALLAGILLLLALPPASPGRLDRRAGGHRRSVGTGVVPLLNVSVANHATNDSIHVTTVQFSDDGRTGTRCRTPASRATGCSAASPATRRWLVRFGAADGSVSPIVKAAIDVDTAGPVDAGRGPVTRAGAGRHGFPVRGPRRRLAAASPPAIVVRGQRRSTRRSALGNVRTGSRAGAREAQASVRRLPLARRGHRPRRMGAGAADGRHVVIK